MNWSFEATSSCLVRKSGNRFVGQPVRALEEADPPVVVAQHEEAGLERIPNSARLSDFLDDMTYQNALEGGALYVGESVGRVQEAQQIQWLEDHWRKARVGPKCFLMDLDVPE
jgi:hypothetical protein